MSAIVAMTLLWPIAAMAAETPTARLAAALDNITTLQRPDQDGYATVWDGNKYVQCRRLPSQLLRCEAAGTRMQPSLGRVLTPERQASLKTLGWRVDAAFGAYVQTFDPKTPTAAVAQVILTTLSQGYGSDLSDLGVETDWIAAEPCPPRNGPSQNLAGMVNDAKAMAATAVHACDYEAPPGFAPPGAPLSVDDLDKAYGARVAGEVQRLRINRKREVYFVVQAPIGYVQCQPETDPDAIYCEAQSADSEASIASVLTPERLARLHAAGYADPGRAPNYSKTYPADTATDASIAHELLALLRDAYGYTGSPKLEFLTEKGEGEARDEDD
jgi:hypothetical protein